MELDKKLYSEINEYCQENGLKTRDFIHKILKEAFLREKYGDSPFKKTKTQQLEEQACKKIQDLIENQVQVPPEIMEAVDEHFFELLGPEKEEKTVEVMPVVISKAEPVQSKPKKKRKLN